MSRNYNFLNPDGIYFVSFSTVDWVDVFTRRVYCDLFLESMEYCRVNKGLTIYAWCIMTNHVHLIFSAESGRKPGDLIGDLKRFTSRALINAIETNPQESRSEWMLSIFRKAGKTRSNLKNFQFWQHDNHPIEISRNYEINQKVDYIHMNPVKSGIVALPEHYLYSSAIDYAGGLGLMKGVVLIC
ncbi:MAG: transposase [Bacteroidetes bacterium]|nr:MAG: transposase [Bacteroidota bacterium]